MANAIIINDIAEFCTAGSMRGNYRFHWLYRRQARNRVKSFLTKGVRRVRL
jgi:hypothetical protein